MSKKSQKAWQQDWPQRLWAAALVERMLPNYQLYCELEQCADNSAAYRALLDLVWQALADEGFKVDFDKQQEKLEAITPIPTEASPYGIWPAQDACVGLGLLLEAMSGQELAVAQLQGLYRSTVEQYLDAVAASEEEGEPLLRDIDAFFHESEHLAREEQSRAAKVKALKSWVREIGVSNIGIETE